MAQISITVNFPVSDPKTFILDLSRYISKMLDKKEKYNAIDLQYNPWFCFGGTMDPAFLMTVTSLDVLTPQNNLKFSSTLSEYMNQKLHIRRDRGYITFMDPGRTHLGWNGQTFASSNHITH